MRCPSTYVFRVPGAASSVLQCEKNKGHQHRHQFVRVWWTDDEEDNHE